MLHLAFIFHMHQPYYTNLLTKETGAPWVRLHGIKDYLDMVEILKPYPGIHQTFNLVPSLLEQVEEFAAGNVKDRFLDLSYKPAAELTPGEKDFLLDRFFSIDRERGIALHPRYYELYFRREQAKRDYTTQDFLDLQVWFNLVWTDPSFRNGIPVLRQLVEKGRFFTEEDKRSCLDQQAIILQRIIPAYKEAIASGQVEVTISPFYHPILPLLVNTKIAKEANIKSPLPRTNFAFPEDAKAQIDLAVQFFKERFGAVPAGMWPSEEGVSEHILQDLITAGIKWIVADEGVLFKSLKCKKRDTRLLYRPHLLQRKDGNLAIVFRDRNLSDLIGFVYHHWKPEDAVNDLLYHLGNINKAYADEDILVAIAMDGENAWEYYTNDGHDFLNELYTRLQDAPFLKTTTVREYLERFPPQDNIRRLAAGSWIYSEFGKWMGNAYKTRAWEWLAEARIELQAAIDGGQQVSDLTWKQIRILEGSDWFWWAGEDPNGDFDRLFRMHLANFYQMINRPAPAYLKSPLTP